MTEQANSIGDTIAARIRKYRLLRGLSIRQVADECARYGLPQLTVSSLANIERGQDESAKRRRRDVTVDELLALAYILAVPPMLLMLPLGEEDEVAILPAVQIHPDLALQWIVGDIEPITSDREVAAHVDLAAFRRDRLPLEMYQTLRRVQEATARAYSDLENAKATGGAVDESRRVYVESLRRHIETVRLMEASGVRSPGVPQQYIDDARTLGVDIPPTVRPFTPRD